MRSSGVLRLAVIPNQEPHFRKDLATGEWSGAALTMARDIARVLGVRVVPVETTWTNAILDLQANKVDLAFGLNPTAERALVVDFSVPLYTNSYVLICRQGAARPATWEELNRPDAKVGVVIGTTYETLAKRYLPKAAVTAYRSRDESLLSVATGHVSYAVDGAILAIRSIKANPNVGVIAVPQPVIGLASCAAMRIDTDKRLRDVMGIWADYNRSVGQTREWLVQAFAAAGVQADEVPREIQF
ncbi:MAG: transporter substrate-binding domain-containing protein [Alphaproteobacteria bacterium]|nr:transporter substrate-binding domain-containing protein [Alphaproteobacteria bacterium]